MGSVRSEITYRKSFAGDDILFSFTLFCNHEVKKPVRVNVLQVERHIVRVVSLVSPHNRL